MNEVRSLENKDLLAYKHLCSICFTYPDAEPAPELTPEQLRIRRGVFDENGMLLSAMMEIPYEVRFCGENVRMVGIGGVVTDPVARSRGAIRAIFEKDLPLQYKEGYVLGALYPFSFRFYGKFGYIWTRFGRNMSISRDAIRSDLCRADEIIRVLPGEDDQGMAEIYRQYISNKNLAVLRTEEMWKECRSGTPWEQLKHAYVLRIGGKPVAYWIGKNEKGDDGAVLTIQDMAWTCQAGLEAIFTMLRSMNEIAQIRLQARSGFEPALVCNEAWDLTAHEDLQGMVRVINAERALALLPAPVLPGTLTIEVTDEQIVENCGRFTVHSDGKVISVTRNDAADADLCCDIRGLTALVMGRHCYADAVELGIAKQLNSTKTGFAALLFAGRSLHLNWNF